MGFRKIVQMMRKLPKATIESLPLPLPSDEVCQFFISTFQTSPQRALEYLAGHYGLPITRIYQMDLQRNVKGACSITEESLTLKNKDDLSLVLQEFYHHLVAYLFPHDPERPLPFEETQASIFARKFISRGMKQWQKH